MRGGVTRILACDISTRKLGWSVDAPPENLPRYGLIELPGMKHIGRLNAAVRNSLTDLIEEHRPDIFIWCRPKFGGGQTTEQALTGIASIAELVAYDNNVRPYNETESHVRKVVLGRGSFGQRDPKTRKIIKGTGTVEAKAAVMRWCARCGLDVDNDDTGDSLVLLAYAKRMLTKRCAR